MEAAIAIFSKYIPKGSPIFHAEHDYLTGPADDELTGISHEDCEKLKNLGWSVGEYDCWMRSCSC